MGRKNENGPEKPAGGCLGTLAKVCFSGVVLAFAVTLAFVLVPQDLSDVGGAGSPLESLPKKDIGAVLQASLDRGHEVSFTEEEINAYLARTLSGKQNGVFGSKASVEGVWVSLEAGRAEVIVKRRVFGWPVTVSTFLQIEQTQPAQGPVKTEVVLHGGPYLPDTYPYRGGRFGRLVVPQGFLLLVKPAFARLAAAYEREIGLVSDMSRIRIEDNRIVFSPNPPDELILPGNGVPPPPSTPVPPR